MAAFSTPERLASDLEKMKAEMTTRLPKEMASAANLMAHPAAGAMALSALGFGLASQAVGSWFGAMSAAAEVSQRFWQPVIDDLAEQAKPFAAPPAGVSAQPRATAAGAAGTALPKTPTKIVKRDATARPDEAIVPFERPKAVAAGASAATARPAAALAETVDVSPLKKADAPDAELAGAQAAAVAPGAETPRQPTALARPEVPGDLKAISGVGPKLEKVLNDLGIWTYAQIAAWTPGEIAWVEDFMGFKGRIGRDGWIAQAVMLGKAAGGGN